jgi:hypothetical protein
MLLISKTDRIMARDSASDLRSTRQRLWALAIEAWIVIVLALFLVLRVLESRTVQQL